MADQVDRCTIELWRGYVSALFYARPVERDVALQLSPPFRIWRLPSRRPVPLSDNLAAKASLLELEEILAAKGWKRTRSEPGTEWYELQFIQNGRSTARSPVPKNSQQRRSSNARSLVPKNGQRGRAAALRTGEAPVAPKPVILPTPREGKGVRRDTRE